MRMWTPPQASLALATISSIWSNSVTLPPLDMASPPCRLDFLDNLERGIGMAGAIARAAQIVDHHLCAAAREFQRICAANPPPAPVTMATLPSFPPAMRPYTGEEVKRAMKGGPLPGTTYDQKRAYLNYIRRLQGGQSGFTCYASLQMPR
jgi:hypothetical protein